MKSAAGPKSGQPATSLPARLRASAKRLAAPRGRPDGIPERQPAAEPGRALSLQSASAHAQSASTARELASEVRSSRAVYCRYVIYSVHSISAVDTSFFVDFKLQMRLVDLTTVHKRSARHVIFLNEENLASIPFITIANAIDAGPCEQPIIRLDPSDPIGIVRWEQRFRGSVRLIQVLHNFPFDHQTLRVQLRTEWNYRRLRPMAGSTILQERALAEWSLHEPLPLHCYVNESGRSCAYIAVQVTRRPRFYTLNVILINFMLCTLTFTVYAFPVDDLGSRADIILTLLLTVMAFKFTIGDLIPHVAYFTFLDLYLFIGIAFLSCVFVECALVHVIHDSDAAYAVAVDEVLFYVILSGWGALHLLLIALVLFYYRRMEADLRPTLDVPEEQTVGHRYIIPNLLGPLLRACVPSSRHRLSSTSKYRWLKAFRYAANVARQERAEAEARLEDERKVNAGRPHPPSRQESQATGGADAAHGQAAPE